MLPAVDSQIEKLLILQDRDVKKLNIEAQLSAIPNEITALEKKISEEKNEMERELQVIKEAEVARNELDLQVKTAEEKIRKYKNQQLEVKKNEEYQALTHEIEQQENAVSELEEKEIEIMLELDEKKAVYASQKAEREEHIQLLEKEIKTLGERESTLNAEIEDATAAVAEAEKGVDSGYLMAYNKPKLRKTKPPFVVELDGQRCKGCHLKVSGEVESGARHYKVEPQAIHCDSCGRVVYWP